MAHAAQPLCRASRRNGLLVTLVRAGAIPARGIPARGIPARGIPAGGIPAGPPWYASRPEAGAALAHPGYVAGPVM
jgi:hypothetical protein